MALIVPDTRGNLRSTHVLVIGIGGYRHLRGGSEPKPQETDNVGALGQLTSPPYSAVAFAQYLIKSQQRLRAPLGSIDLLMSLAPGEPSPLPPGMDASPATFDDIQEAYTAWRNRCDRDPGNIAIFYFCGHGAELDEQFLLAEDFGKAPGTPWRHAFAFNSTRIAFNSCRAETQCFFIDACRETTPDMLVSRPKVSSLDDEKSVTSNCLYDLTIQASARNERAFGRKRAPSYFVRALMKALDGAAASPRVNKPGWVVKTADISTNINRIMTIMKTPGASNQRCVCVVTDVAELMNIDGIPSVAITLGCNPELANEAVELKCTRLTMPPRDPLLHTRGPWSLTVEAGTYWLEAIFHDRSFQSDPQEVLIVPPEYRGSLECRP